MCAYFHQVFPQASEICVLGGCPLVLLPSCPLLESLCIIFACFACGSSIRTIFQGWLVWRSVITRHCVNTVQEGTTPLAVNKAIIT